MTTLPESSIGIQETSTNRFFSNPLTSVACNKPLSAQRSLAGHESRYKLEAMSGIKVAKMASRRVMFEVLYDHVYSSKLHDSKTRYQSLRSGSFDKWKVPTHLFSRSVM